ncbi:3-oxoadipate enol-lactonase [Nocardia sp. IFM 10818]
MSVSVNFVAEGPEGGPVVVLSGSIGSDLRMWGAQVGPLTSAGYRVIRMDHRGHGGSPTPEGPYSLADLGGDAVGLLDRLGAERAHWVGLSLGGMVGMWLGENAGERLASLTLCCTSAELPPVNWADRARIVREKGMGWLAETSMNRWFTAGWQRDNPEGVRYFSAMVASQSVEGYVSCCAAIETMDIAAGLGGIATPTLVISGADDPATTPEDGHRIAAAIPGARFEIVGPGAHLATTEAAAQVNPLILEHLKENS